MSLDPRRNRLMTDYEKLLDFEANSSFLNILEAAGSPPKRYLFLLNCRGVIGLDANGLPLYSTAHRLRIDLPATYPRNIPVFKMLTPVWHPNISEHGEICMGHEGEKGYSPSMPLRDLIMRIIQIIRYENYSKEYYVNKKAFEWTRQNSALFPLDSRPILETPVDIRILGHGINMDLLDEIKIQ